MLLSAAKRAALPPTLPLAQAPVWAVPLSAPPEVAWLGVGRHGRWAREDYRLPGLWCVHLYRWSGALRVDGVALPVRPGYASLVPPDRPLSHFFRSEGGAPALHVSAGFALPGGDGDGVDGVAHAPMVQDLGDAFGPLHRAMEEAVGFFGARPERARARLWEILWALSETAAARRQQQQEEPTRTAAPGEHPAVGRAREIIELRLAEPLRVAELAAELDLSHNHLTRLFRASVGTSVVAYIRARRVARARLLLAYTTLPVKNVAAQVGVPDPHAFNKLVRAATGLSPRALRDAGTRTPRP